MRKPVEPVFPMFTAMCIKCGHRTNSLSGVCGELPWTWVCFSCQTDEERESVRLHTNAAVQETSPRYPYQVASARRQLGIRRPRNVPMSPSWEGCEVEA